MKRPAVLLIVTVLGSLLALAPATSASADSVSGRGLTVSTGDVAVPAGSCGTATTRISGDMGSAPHWDVTLTVYDPHGRWVSAAQLDETNPARTLASRVCAGDPGRYRVRADYTTYDYQLHATSVRVLESSFTVSRPALGRSALSATPAAAKRAWAVRGTLQREGRAWTGHRVSLQVRQHGGWHTVARRTTDAAGHVSFRVAPGTKARQVRLVTTGDAHVAGATSALLRLPRR